MKQKKTPQQKVKLLPEVTNGFYSPIEKKLLDEKAENLSATKWLERLGKGDEVEFTGLKDFVESKKPNEHPPYRDWETDRKSTRLNSSHRSLSRMPSSA